MSEKIQIMDDQLLALLVKLFSTDKDAAEELVEKARKAAEAGEDFQTFSHDVDHSRGVAC